MMRRVYTCDCCDTPVLSRDDLYNVGRTVKIFDKDSPETLKRTRSTHHFCEECAKKLYVIFNDFMINKGIQFT